jgi:O-methyltransferase
MLRSDHSFTVNAEWTTRQNMHTMTKKLLARLLWPRYSLNVDLLNRNAQMFSRFRNYEISNSLARFRNRSELYQAINARFDNTAISYLEFGVWKGASLRDWAVINNNSDSRFYGFDSFEGFPEVWDHGFGHSTKKEHFALGGEVPHLSDPRVKLIRGWFQQTLGDFLVENELVHPIIIHIDCDLHSSALFVLATLNPILKSADVIIFDEYTSPVNEFLAWEEYQRAFIRKAQCIAMSDRWSQTAFTLVE